MKKVGITFANFYTCLNIGIKNIKLISLINQFEKKIDLVENLLGEMKSSLRNMKSIFKSMQEIIDRVLQVLIKINAAIGLNLLINKVTLN